VDFSSVYLVAKECIASLDSLPSLQLHFPVADPEGLNKIAATFSAKARHIVFSSVGCV